MTEEHINQINPFAMLLDIEVRDFTSSKKGGGGKELVYLPWAKAVEEVCKHYPDTTWEVVEYPEYFLLGEHLVQRMVPFQQTSRGFFVQTKVTVNGVEKPMWLPILDNYNKQVDAPTVVQINKTLMRCLVKNLAAHGLGIKMYMKEDASPEDEAKPTKPPVDPKAAEKKALLDQVVASVNAKGIGFNEVTKHIKVVYSKDKSTDLDAQQLSELLNVIKEGTLKE